MRAGFGPGSAAARAQTRTAAWRPTPQARAGQVRGGGGGRGANLSSRKGWVIVYTVHLFSGAGGRGSPTNPQRSRAPHHRGGKSRRPGPAAPLPPRRDDAPWAMSAAAAARPPPPPPPLPAPRCRRGGPGDTPDGAAAPSPPARRGYRSPRPRPGPAPTLQYHTVPYLLPAAGRARAGDERRLLADHSRVLHEDAVGEALVGRQLQHLQPQLAPQHAHVQLVLPLRAGEVHLGARRAAQRLPAQRLGQRPHHGVRAAPEGGGAAAQPGHAARRGAEEGGREGRAAATAAAGPGSW